MRIIFAGTPAFAATALAAILDAGYEVPLVLTQPDRPAGRGHKPAPSAVKDLAMARGLEVATPATLRLKKGSDAAAAAHAQIQAVQADVLVVAAYGLILPQAVLELPRGLPDAGCGRVTALNIHGSLLPRWRGAAPIARAIEAGDEITGITIMQMDAGLDTGPMLLAEASPITANESTAMLTERLADLGARLIVAALRDGAAGRLRAVRQAEDGATYAHKLDKREAWLDFSLPADVLARRIRAFDPFPGACTSWQQQALKIWKAQAAPTESATAPGTVIEVQPDGIFVACSSGMLRLTELQRPGGRRLPVREFNAGVRIRIGDVFMTPLEVAAEDSS